MSSIIKRAAVAALAAIITIVWSVSVVTAAEMKDQTVYVISDAAGSVTKVIGPEETDSTELPVDIHISYKLDGSVILPEELAGKTGHLIIRFSYDNHTTAPFMMITGLLLDSTVFYNVEVTGGQLLDDGSRMIAAGITFPGLQESLDPEEDIISLPEEFVLEADVTDFKLDIVYSIALSGLLDNLDETKLNSLDELADSAEELDTAMSDILSGAQDLCDGTEILKEGLEEITSHNTELTDGAKQVFESLLSAVQEKIANAGMEIEPLTIENYSEILESLISLDISGQAREEVEAQIDAMGDTLYVTYLESQQDDIVSAYLQNHSEDICKTYILAQIPEEQLSGLEEVQINSIVSMQLEALTEEEKGQILEGARMQLTNDQIADMIAGAAMTLTQEQKDQIREGAVEQGMASDEVQTKIATAEEQMTSLQSAKNQLDSYMLFYTGLLDYTGGVQSASDGASELDTGVEALKDGLDKFDEDGIQVIVDTLETKLGHLLEHVHGVIQNDQEYQFNDTDGSVRFIYKISSIGGTSE